MNVRLPIAILGAGNIGCAIARGLALHGDLPAGEITLCRRRVDLLAGEKENGFRVTDDGAAAVRDAATVILAVGPGQLCDLLDSVAEAIAAKKPFVISVVSGVSIARCREHLGDDVPLVRAMPNTAVDRGESMTCLAAETLDAPGLDEAASLFDRVGRTLVIRENQMSAATSLCACGVAFFLRAIRAASQGGIEIGFHSDEAYLLAGQTARGAATLLLGTGGHPESEIDRVTTPEGCTIAGLNEMEHRGFSSALIKGIVKSAGKAEGLFDKPKE